MHRLTEHDTGSMREVRGLQLTKFFFSLPSCSTYSKLLKIACWISVSSGETEILAMKNCHIYIHFFLLIIFPCTCMYFLVCILLWSCGLCMHMQAAASSSIVMEDRCFFGELYSCLDKTPLSQTSAERIIQASKQYEDGLHIGLEHQQDIGIETIPVHRKCVDRYCHKKSIQKAVRERADSRCLGEDLMSMPKRARRSIQPTFSFIQHCLFCGKQCDTEKDPKHPGRWRPAYVCREGEKFRIRSLRDAIYDTCERRSDDQSEQVRVRMAGVLSDLHAADVRYHVDCRASFMSPRSIKAAARQSYTDQLVDTALNSVSMYMASNKTITYSSVDLYDKYVEEGGQELSRRQLVTSIIDKFGDVIALSSPGIATLLTFKATAAKMFHMIPDDTDDICDMIEKISKN